MSKTKKIVPLRIKKIIKKKRLFVKLISLANSIKHTHIYFIV